MELYVKPTSNYPRGYQLTTFEELSQTWVGRSIVLPFGPQLKRKKVVGWTDLFAGSPCAVSVTRVRTSSGSEGYLVWGGNSGVRILDGEATREEWEAHLPRGTGMPFVWVDVGNVGDLPQAVVKALQLAPSQGETDADIHQR